MHEVIFWMECALFCSSLYHVGCLFPKTVYAMRYTRLFVFNTVYLCCKFPNKFRSANVTLYILNHVSQRIQSNIHSAQFSFVNGRSYATQLLSNLNIVGSWKELTLDKGLQTGVVFIDNAKAFDTVDHSKICCKNCGTMVFLVLFSSGLKNYLCRRLQRVSFH